MLKEIPFFLFIVLCFFPNCLVEVFTLFLSLLCLVTPITTALLLPIYYMGLMRSPQVQCYYCYKRSYS